MAARRIACLAEVGNPVLLDASAPVSFCEYLDKPSYLVPDACTVDTLTAPGAEGESIEATRKRNENPG